MKHFRLAAAVAALIIIVNYTNDQAAVHFTRKVVVDATLIPRDKYGALRIVYGKITSADQEQVVLRKAAAKAEK